MGIREHGGVAQKQAQVQVGDAGGAAEDQAVNVHQHHTGEIEQVEFQGAPGVFHHPAQRIVAEQGDGNEQQIAVSGAVGQRIGKQPPDLPMEDGLPVEAQQIIQGVVAGKLAHKVDNGAAHADVEHQVGDALVPVFVAEKIKLSADIFQSSSLL